MRRIDPDLIARLMDREQQHFLQIHPRSAERFAQAKGSLLGGVPIAIKEDVDVEGLPTRHGSGWRPNTPAVRDAVAVERLRRAAGDENGRHRDHESSVLPVDR